MRYVPWLTLGVTLLLAITPMGQQLIQSSIHNGEQLAQSIDRFVLSVISAAMAGIALVEVAVRASLARRRRARQAANGETPVDRGQ